VNSALQRLPEVASSVAKRLDHLEAIVGRELLVRGPVDRASRMLDAAVRLTPDP